MAQKQKIIFDLDGTLIDVSERHWRVYKMVTEAFRGMPLDKRTYWELKRAKTPWPNILAKSGVAAGKLQDYLNRFIELIEQPRYLKLDQLFPFTNDLLNSLGGYELFLVSLRRHEDRLVDELRWLGLYERFSKVITGHTESEGYELKVRLIRDIVGEEPAVVVGDTEADVKAAQAVGATSVAVLSGIRDEAYLRSLKPDHVIASIAELPSLIA